MEQVITANEYHEFCNFLKSVTGIKLGENKQYLVSSRLSRLLADNQVSNISELLSLVKQPSGRQLLQLVIDAMTTNETNWFRDVYPFQVLFNKLLPEMSPHGRARIWCAACSSGQEPYSISMALEEEKKKVNGYRGELEIIATDLSSGILEKAKLAEFDQLSLSRGLSDERKKLYFDIQEDGGGTFKANLRQKINFKQLNLKESYSSLGKFDVIFCRNVLIYFQEDLKKEILKKISNSLKPQGYLFLGASESVRGFSEAFEMVRCNPGIVYKLKP